MIQKNPEQITGRAIHLSRNMPSTPSLWPTSWLPFSAASAVPVFYLILYFVLEFFLLFHTKWIFSKIGFHFPWFLAAIRIGISGICSFLAGRLFSLSSSFSPNPSSGLTTHSSSFPLLKRQSKTPISATLSSPRLDGSRTHLRISKAQPFFTNRRRLVFSSLFYGLSIALSLLAINSVSISFFQLSKSILPLFLLSTEAIVFKFFPPADPTSHSMLLYLTLVPLAFGLMLFSLSEATSHLSFTLNGMLLAFGDSFVTALRTLLSSSLLISLTLHPLKMHVNVAPFCVVLCLSVSWFLGELEDVCRFIRNRYTRSDYTAFVSNASKRDGDASFDSHANPTVTPKASYNDQTTSSSTDWLTTESNPDVFSHHSTTFINVEGGLDINCNSKLEDVSFDPYFAKNPSSRVAKYHVINNMQFLDSFFDFLPVTLMDLVLVLFSNGLLAFLLSWVRFTSIERCSITWMSMFNCIKQALLVFLSMKLGDGPLSFMHICAALITLGAGALYRYLAHPCMCN